MSPFSPILHFLTRMLATSFGVTLLLLIMYEALHIMDIKTALIYNTICFWFSHLPLKMCALFMQGWVCAHFLIGTGNRTFWFLSILLLTCIAMEISWN